MWFEEVDFLGAKKRRTVYGLLRCFGGPRKKAMERGCKKRHKER